MVYSLELVRPRARPKPASAADSKAWAAGAKPRIVSIDLLRGLIMVLMALDHTRDFFGAGGSMNPRDVGEPALFLTRWITHFCAPLFIFLAGTSAWLYEANGRDVREVGRFLFTRGLFLIVMEFTILRFGWTFDPSPSVLVAQVIWVIGASMVALSVLVYLPRPAVAALGLAMIAGHNLLDHVRSEHFGAAGWIWSFVHEPRLLRPSDGFAVLPLYSLIPWIGVMAAGYALGPVFALDRASRVRRLVILGTLVTASFVLLRLTNLYGDPAPWIRHESALATILSFVNCEKYPPSLLYLMMTLGPGLLLLAAFESARGAVAEWFAAFGRVPLFYYVAHLYLIHCLAIAFALTTVGEASWLYGGGPGTKPAAYGLGLPGVYAVTLLVVVTLNPLCRWFGRLKRDRKEWWWSYL